ncbi:MAG: thiamine pyrophosphate-binding protein [Chloroflexi bacterium]|nr:thiamine pyrophosphate-binding protein [Chloroflexota bacterium]
MSRVNGGEMVARVLASAGVRELFTLHGGHLDPILEACDRQGFRIIDVRHEQAAGHMADGWARATGRVGVCADTAGPGTTDAVTAVTNAYLDCVPMLVLGGRSPLLDDETLPLQGMPQLEMMRPITKWSRTVYHTQRIPDLTAMALRQAITGRPGPVYLELPIDVLFGGVEEERVSWPAQFIPEAAPAAQPEAVARALELLAAAQRPAIMAGGGVWFAGAAAELREFAEMTETPVFANSKARGAVPEDGPLGFNGYGLMVSSALGGQGGLPDVILILGARLGMFTGGRRSIIPPDAKVIQVDIEPAEIGRNRDIQLGIAGDCRQVLRQLIAGAKGRRWPSRAAWLDALTTAKTGRARAFAHVLDSDATPIHPHRLGHDIAASLDDDAIVVADGGEAADWIGSALQQTRPGSFLSHGYLGCLGVGLPFGAAAKLAFPDRQVLVVSGDGSVGLNFAEFDTMARHNLPVVKVVFNDGAWGMSKHGQQMMFQGRTVATELGLVHYEKAAEGFGCHAELVERPAEIRPALERAFASGRPACLNVLIDGEPIAPVTLALMGMAAPPPKAPAPAPAAEEKKASDETLLPYYGKRKV